MAKVETLGNLKNSGIYPDKYRHRTVKDEMRENLIRKLGNNEELFPGIIGFEETVIPHIVNAILSKHNMILLGLRGQAKSRILRDLVAFLDDELPVVEGCEINDNPYAPICHACKMKIVEKGDDTPITFITREERYVEKLATPDVTIADIIGDIDPIRAAKGGLHLSDELTIHYGLLPRANRGIFAVNELPDLAGKIQVGLFNILQEGDIQIKGYPVRLPLDVVLVFTANPEDYTARGKIITPLKDRIGSEIRTHYPIVLEEGIAITEQEAWTDRFPGDNKLIVPHFIKEIVEEIAFAARKDKKIDNRSGVSQRLPITCMENMISNAERRAIIQEEERIVPRINDIYSALPSITGKFELEYEGELKGADMVAKELIKRGIDHTFNKYFSRADLSDVESWFNLGGSLKISNSESSSACMKAMKEVSGLIEGTSILGINEKDDIGLVVSSAEFILEGLHSQRRVGRSEEKGFYGIEIREPKQSYGESDDFGEKDYGKFA